jgi:hypothetical protein
MYVELQLLIQAMAVAADPVAAAGSGGGCGATSSQAGWCWLCWSVLLLVVLQQLLEAVLLVQQDLHLPVEQHHLQDRCLHRQRQQVAGGCCCAACYG